MSNDTLVLFTAQRDTLELLPPEGGTLRLVPVGADTLQLQVAVGGSGGSGTGDMLKSVYDTNGDGVVNQAEVITSQGDAATLNVGTTAGTVAAGNHNHTGVYQPLNSNLTGWAGEDPDDYSTKAEADALYQPLDGDLTSIGALTDPNADRILFWDDSAGKYDYLTAGTGLTITGTTIEAAGAGANTALSNLASVAINTSLLPGSNDGAALGSAALSFSDLFLADQGAINWLNGDAILAHTSAGAVQLSGDGGVTLELGISGGTSPGNLAIYNNAGALIHSFGSTALSPAVNLSGEIWHHGGDLKIRDGGLWLRESSGASGTHYLKLYASETLSANRTLNFAVGDADKTITFAATGTYSPSGKTNIASGSFASANTQVLSAAIPDGYSYLVITFDGLSSDTATRQPLFQVSTDAGATYDTTAGNYEYHNITGTTILKPALASLGSTVSVTAAQTFSGCIKISNYQGGMRPTFEGHVYANGVYYRVFGTYVGSTLNIDGLRMIWNSTGNSDAGTWSLDGVA